MFPNGFTSDFMATLIKEGSHKITPRNGVITFGFAGGNEQLSSVTQDWVRYMFKEMVEPFINVKFVETSGKGDINFQLHDEPEYYAFAQGHDVFLSRSHDNNSTNSGFQSGFGSHGFMTLVHETLHAMGLMHPGNYNGDGGGSGPFLNYEQDNTTNSIMSYNFAGAGAITPMPYDIAALQFLYGASNQNSGDTTYRFSSVYSFNDGMRNWGSFNTPSKLALWDRSGFDTLDFSQLQYSSSGYVLDARAGGILTTGAAYNSSIYNPKDASSSGRDFWDLDVDGDKLEILSIQNRTSAFGTTVALGVDVERIIGSQSNDLIIGGAGRDTIFGNNGNDKIFGDNGNSLQPDLNGDDRLLGGAGNDQIWGEAGNDVLLGQQGDDILFGGLGNDTLLGSDSFISAERDQLYGGAGQDWFILGNQQGSFYQGNGFAVIKDWQPGLDKIQLGRTSGRYSLATGQLSGGAALDTGIYHNGDLVGIVEDSVNVNTSRGDFVIA